jgi:hypothetical protein
METSTTCKLGSQEMAYGGREERALASPPLFLSEPYISQVIWNFRSVSRESSARYP